MKQTVRQKTGGRIAGTPNKITVQMRSMLACVLDDEIENLPTLLDKLAPGQRINAFFRLAELVLPNDANWDTVTKIPSFSSTDIHLIPVFDDDNCGERS